MAQDDINGSYLKQRNNAYLTPSQRMKQQFQAEAIVEDTNRPFSIMPVIDFAGDVIGDVAGGIVEIPKQAAGGVLDATKELAQFLESAIPLGTLGGDDLTEDSFIELGEPRTVTGGLVRGVSQFLSGFLPAMKGAKAAGLATKGAKGVATAMGAGAVADAIVFDPHEDRLSNLVEQFPEELQNPVTGYLAADPDDSDAEGRFKNAIEGLALGALAEGFFAAAKGIKAARVNRIEEDKLASEMAQIDSLASIDVPEGNGVSLDEVNVEQVEIPAPLFGEDNRLSNINKDGGMWAAIKSENPDVKDSGKVTVYRATIGDEITPNDYVALNKDIAEAHLDNLADRGETGKIITQEIDVDELMMANDATEFVYTPKAKPADAPIKSVDYKELTDDGVNQVVEAANDKFEINIKHDKDLSDYPDKISIKVSGSTAKENGIIATYFDDGVYQINSASLDKSRRGKGEGVELYEEFLTYADAKGFGVVSDSIVSEKAINVYDALKKKGYKVEENTGVSVSPKGNKSVSPKRPLSESWVFRISKQSKPIKTVKAIDKEVAAKIDFHQKIIDDFSQSQDEGYLADLYAGARQSDIESDMEFYTDLEARKAEANKPSKVPSDYFEPPRTKPKKAMGTDREREILNATGMADDFDADMDAYSRIEKPFIIEDGEMVEASNFMKDLDNDIKGIESVLVCARG